MRQTKVKRLHPDAILPEYGYPGDAGMDLSVIGRHVLQPGESKDLPTGIAVEMPPGLWGRITSRSSTLRKRGLFVNEGVIDNGYRGELLIYVTNRNSYAAVVQTGDRLGQLILSDVRQAPGAWTEELAESARGDKGFGSTGHQDWTREEQDTFQWRLYVGGPVDYAKQDPHGLFHMFGEEGLYCPMCQFREGESAATTISRNMEACLSAQWAVFFLTGEYTVGTPIEAWLRAEASPDRTVIISGSGGLFVRYWSEKGARIVGGPEAARRLVGL